MPKLENWKQLQGDWRRLVAEVSSASTRVTTRADLFPMRFGRPTVLFAELEDVRSSWSELRASAEVQQNYDRCLTSQWTVKDLLAHMASWWRETRKEVETVAQGEHFGYSIPFAFSVLGPTEWNQVEVEKRRSIDIAAVFAEGIVEIEKVQATIIELPSDVITRPALFPLAPSGDPSARLKANIAQIILGQCAHQRMHICRVEQWRTDSTRLKLQQ